MSMSNSKHKGEAWQLVSELILNPFLCQECRGLVSKAGHPPGEESARARGQLCRLPHVCQQVQRKVCCNSTPPPEERRGACESVAVCQYSVLLWHIWYDQLCFQALLWRFAINFFIALSRCPPPLPALHPLIGAPPPSPCSIVLNETVWIFHIYLFFFSSSPSSFVFW